MRNFEGSYKQCNIQIHFLREDWVIVSVFISMTNMKTQSYTNTEKKGWKKLDTDPYANYIFQKKNTWTMYHIFYYENKKTSVYC